MKYSIGFLLIFIFYQSSYALMSNEKLKSNQNQREGYWKCISQESDCLKILTAIEGNALIQNDSSLYTIELLSNNGTDQTIESLDQNNIIFQRQKDVIHAQVLEISTNQLFVFFEDSQTTVQLSINLKEDYNIFNGLFFLILFSALTIICFICLRNTLRENFSKHQYISLIPQFLNQQQYYQFYSWWIFSINESNFWAIIAPCVFQLFVLALSGFLLGYKFVQQLFYNCIKLSIFLLLIAQFLVFVLTFMLVMNVFDNSEISIIIYILATLPLITQIIDNVRLKKRVTFNFSLYFPLSFPFINIIYFTGYPNNLSDLDPNYYICLVFVFLISVLLLFVYFQSKKGPQFYRNIFRNNVIEEDCSFCLEPLYFFDENQQILKQGILHGKIIITKCNHKFHYECLVKWNAVQNTCPYCLQKFDN